MKENSKPPITSIQQFLRRVTKIKRLVEHLKRPRPQNTAENISNKVDDLSNKIIDEVKKGFDQNALMPKLHSF